MGLRAELRFASRAWLAAPAVELSLAVAGLHRTLQWIERSSPPPTRSSRRRTDTVNPDRGARLVDRAYGVHALRGQCLPRALLQYWLHRRDGTAVRFVVGIRKGPAANGEPRTSSAPATLEAHAWVEPLAKAGRRGPGSAEEFEVLLERESTGADGEQAA